jgi:hypothetical protein
MTSEGVGEFASGHPLHTHPAHPLQEPEVSQALYVAAWKVD